MSRLRTDFYNDSPVEGDAAYADKDARTIDFVGNADADRRTTFRGLPRLPLAYGLQNRAVTGWCRRQG